MTETTKTTTNPTVSEPAAPKRRVGSLTLGVCLILAGLFFLLYYFWPSFNWELVLKIAPAAGLVALGAEVLYFTVRPGRWRLDFLSVLGCLFLMACCFGLSFLPMLTDLIDPVRQQELDVQREQFTRDAYTAFSDDAPQIRLRDVEGYLSFHSWADSPKVEYSTLRVELRGPYQTPESFAKDCYALTQSAQDLAIVPDQLLFFAEDDTQTFRLELDGPVQQDWTLEEMTAELSHSVYEVEVEDTVIYPPAEEAEMEIYVMT